MSTEKEMKKHKLWLDQAHRFAQESKDRSTKVGCVLVSPRNRFVSSGWNGFAEGIDDSKPERHERPAKYEWSLCAEQNAVANAAREGHMTDGATAYLNWHPTCPCGKCISILRNAGIVRIVGPNRPFAGKGSGIYYHQSSITSEIIAETGIEIVVVEHELLRQS